MFDEGVVRVSSGEGQLAERAATNSALFRLHPQLQTEANGTEVGTSKMIKGIAFKNHKYLVQFGHNQL